MIRRYFAALLLAGISSPVFAQSLPALYDLRAVSTSEGILSWVPAIQDQGLFGDCWTFASATAMNSNLQMNGLLSTSNTPPAITISSWALSTQNGAAESLVGPNYGGDGQHTWGGFEYQAMGYVTRGQGTWAIPGVDPSSTTRVTTMGGGPTTNSTTGNPFPTVFQDSPPLNIGYLLPPTNQTPAYQVRKVVMFDQGAGNNVALPTPVSPDNYDFNQGANDPQVIAVKNAINTYGAVTTSMNANEYSYFKDISNGDGTYTINYFNPSTNPNNTDHEVTIIGWDDNYVMTDPDTNVTYTGAWIVQNSWGTVGWGGGNHVNNGTFYAAYDDAAIGRSGVAAFQVGSIANYSPTVLQNELGPIGSASNFVDSQGVLGMVAHHSKEVASILTPEESGYLAALGIASQLGDVDVHISIYSDWINGPGGTLLQEMDVTLSGIGYELFDLASLLELTADDSIVVMLAYSEFDAAPLVLANSVLEGEQTPHNLSFYYDTGDSTWKDLADGTYASYSGDGPDAEGAVLFLKGVVAIPEPSTCFLLIATGGVMLFLRRARRQTA